MEWDVTEVKVVGDFALAVRFRDGLEGGVRFLPSFFRGAFTHLAKLPEFQKVQVVDGVVSWPGELDLAPDAMYAEIKRSDEWLLN
ncbi:DUF2442 domain-containing protein [Janthinobacterium sp.]|uniref:DUF2442 domain-containing protein n=1 Tax=Janthinobacterium sp. TaxID=1871054 RepID=UPI00293D984B|nr:DUF2442 domain-containing protein [Janthinobacterium sp.]